MKHTLPKKSGCWRLNGSQFWSRDYQILSMGKGGRGEGSSAHGSYYKTRSVRRFATPALTSTPSPENAEIHSPVPSTPNPLHSLVRSLTTNATFMGTSSRLRSYLRSSSSGCGKLSRPSSQTFSDPSMTTKSFYGRPYGHFHFQRSRSA